MTNATTAINELIEQSTQEHHDLGDGAITTEYIVQLAEGITLHFFTTDYSGVIRFDALNKELEIFMTDELAEVLINRNTATAADLLSAIAEGAKCLSL